MTGPNRDGTPGGCPPITPLGAVVLVVLVAACIVLFVLSYGGTQVVIP